jgi:outer membrane protein assembly factor BamA
MYAQQGTVVHYSAYNSQPVQTMAYGNKAAAVLALNKLHNTLLTQGYLNASIDTVCNDTVVWATVLPDKKYFLKDLTIQTDMESIAVDKQKLRSNTPLDSTTILEQTERVLASFENRGFPFAKLDLYKLSIDTAMQASATFRLNPGPKMVLDTVIIVSSTKLPAKYIRSFVGMGKGDFYNEEEIQGLKKKLNGLKFLQTKRLPEVRFRQNKFELYIYLEKKKANYFNGILGLRPNELTGKVNITGDAEVKLVNTLNTGEEFYLNWRKLQPQTQDLTVRTSLPYLFSTPFGAEGEIRIYRRDSTFSSVKTNAGVVFNFGGSDRLKLFVEKNLTSTLASYTTAAALGNVNTTLYGLALHKEKLDYIYNPRKGYSTQLDLATGTRKVGDNNQNETPSGAANTDRTINRALYAMEYYIPTWKKQCIRFASQGATMIASAIFDNESFRVGGLRTFRGVNEESIFATTWAMASVEYRLLFEENSALYLFADQSWYEKKTVNQFVTDTPLGFGAGINFETNAGIFTFNYALGKQFDAPILIRNAKISFGFRNVF